MSYPLPCQIDISDKLERATALETNLGLRFEAFSAYQDEPDDDGESRVAIMGEVHASKGDRLAADIDLCVALYDSRGRMVAEGSEYIAAEQFFSFQTFRLNVFAPAVAWNTQFLKAKEMFIQVWINGCWPTGRPEGLTTFGLRESSTERMVSVVT